jgi:hypothetical protein
MRNNPAISIVDGVPLVCEGMTDRLDSTGFTAEKLWCAHALVQATSLLLCFSLEGGI